MMPYRAIKALSEGLVGLTGSYGPQLWSLGTLRKDWACQHCAGDLKAGVQAWAPITNASNRMHRLCSSCVARLAGEEVSR